MPVARVGRHPVVYVVQAALPAATIGHRVVRDASDDEVRDLLAAVVERIARVFSDHPDGARVGLDARSSGGRCRACSIAITTSYDYILPD